MNDIINNNIINNDIVNTCIINVKDYIYTDNIHNDIANSYIIDDNLNDDNVNNEDDLISETSTITENSDFFQVKPHYKFILNKQGLTVSINLNKEDFIKINNGFSKISDEEKALIVASIQTTSISLYKLEKQKNIKNIWYSDFIFGKQIHIELFNLWIELNQVFENTLINNNKFINNICQIQKILNSIAFDNSYEKELTDLKKIIEIYIKLRQLNDKSLLIKYNNYINENIMNVFKCKKISYYTSKRSGQIESKINIKIKKYLIWEKIKDAFSIKIRYTN